MRGFDFAATGVRTAQWPGPATAIRDRDRARDYDESEAKIDECVANLVYGMKRLKKVIK